MRKINFANGEYYHIFNRGADKRVIFSEQNELKRFFQNMEEFNTIKPIGSIYQNSFRKNKLRNQVSKQEKSVNFICYCLNPNHYHFILKQLVDRGIEKFMHRLGVGYAKYFNQKHDRKGVLFEGPFKATLIDTDEYLLHLSVYVNLNYKVHQLRNQVSKSSWDEYMGDKKNNKNDFCEKDIVLNQFKDVLEYKKFAENSLRGIRERKDMKKLLLD